MSANIDEEAIKVEATHATPAYFTLQDVRANGLKIQTGANHGILVHNVNFIDICERSIKGPDAPVTLDGEVRFCLFEQKTPITADIPNLHFNGDYIAGMDLMKIENWSIHDNAFKNIRGMNGGGRAGIFLWNGCKRVVVERNLFLGCDRSISFGNPSGAASDMDGGVIRNNFIVAGVDISLELGNITGSLVAHNTVFSANAGFSRTVSFSTDGAGNSVKNILVLGRLSVASGVAPDTVGNLWLNSAGAATGWFLDPASGDLHLTSAATAAIGMEKPLPEVTGEIDGLNKIGWMNGSIVDMLNRYEVQIVGTGTTDFTPRRLQNFRVEPNTKYRWWLNSISGTGTEVVADSTGTLALAGVTLLGTTKLIIQPAVDFPEDLNFAVKHVISHSPSPWFAGTVWFPALSGSATTPIDILGRPAKIPDRTK